MVTVDRPVFDYSAVCPSVVKSQIDKITNFFNSHACEFLDVEDCLESDGDKEEMPSWLQ
jgi:hypothetical protein